jgi:DNA-binding response OmpR family regulator
MEKTLYVDDLTLYVDRRQVTRRGELIPLTRLEFDLLLYLAQHRGRVVPYEELLEQVWKATPGPDPSRPVQKLVWRLRGKLDDDLDAPRYILNVRGVGYRMP